MIDENNCEEHEAYLRGVARGLTPCSQAADDLVQDTLLYVLKRQPTHLRAPKAWLRRVIRSIAINRALSETRRRHREERVATLRSSPSSQVPESLVRRVRLAIARLPQPYRIVVEPYYLQGIGVRQLAQQTGLSEDAIKSRLKRAREKLRDALGAQAEEGWDSRGFVAGLATRLSQPQEAPHPFRTLALSAAGAAATVWMALVLAFASAERGEVETASAQTAQVTFTNAGRPSSDADLKAPAARAREASIPSLPSVATVPRTLAPTDTGPSDAAANLGSSSTPFRVIDTRTRPIPGAAVRSLPASLLHTSQADTTSPPPSSRMGVSGPGGRGMLPNARAGEMLVVDSPGWTTVFAGLVSDADPPTHLIVAGRAMRARGVVVDENGQPIQGAVITIRCNRDLAQRILERPDADLQRLALVPRRVTTARDGNFSVPAVSNPEALEVRATRSGYKGSEWRPLEAHNRFALQAYLAPNAISGRVVDEHGQPAPRAWVSAGWRKYADADGNFAVPAYSGSQAGHFVACTFGEQERDLWAVVPGSLPGRARIHPALPKLAQPVLRLGGVPHSASGHVLAANGAPRKGVEVWILDPTFFDCREGLWSLEQAIRGESSWAPTRTDADGFFELDGLRDRAYMLAVRDPETGARQVIAAAPGAAEGLRITLGAGRDARVVRGTVVSPDGKPATGVVVAATRTRQRIVATSGELVFVRRERTAETVTDSEGRFALRVRDEDALTLQRVGSAPRTFDLGEPATHELRITLPRAARIALSRELKESVSSYEVRDRFGSLLQGAPSPFGPRDSFPKHRLSPGNATTFSEEAAELVLYRKDGTEERRSISIQPGETYIARP